MITFENFMSLDSGERKRILHDHEQIIKMIRVNLSDHRFEHSLSVADTARMLAGYHHVDQDKAYLAGLLHDCTKGFDESFHDQYLKYYDPEKLDMPEGIKHSFSAKYYLREMLNLHDKDILNAIYNHTICNSKDRLSLILFIADKREPLRNIEDDILDIAKKDLYSAYRILLTDIERYIKDNRNERFITNSI